MFRVSILSGIIDSSRPSVTGDTPPPTPPPPSAEVVTRWSMGMVVVEASSRHDLWADNQGWNLDSDDPIMYYPVYTASQLWSAGTIKLNKSGEHYWSQGYIN